MFVKFIQYKGRWSLCLKEPIITLWNTVQEKASETDSSCSFNYSSVNLITSVGDVLLGGWYFFHTMRCTSTLLVSINLMKKLQLEKKWCIEHLFEHREKSNGKQACVMRTYCLCNRFWITKSTDGFPVIVQGLS